MKRLNRNGFTLFEAVASIAIVAIVLTTAAILVANGYDQSVATSRQVDAIEVGTLIRDEIVAAATYAEVDAWLSGAAKELTVDVCDDPSSPFSCTLFTHEVDGLVYDAEVVVRFSAPTAESLLYRVVRFTVTVTYYGSRTVEIEGMVYDD